ncbi:MAG: BPSS1780 family membrane protein [Thiothrix sp.]|uniref:BPSS1780 family membrane protein n=1 Tax=Thiothrix sp. TaxID=1032 RepID=UPI0026085BC4|nr:BPSS1780 family membrane protein [Thiothrix sp.]MDD5393097.1 BPSS1780 family membrane protein [Thiothrix sp.]
MSDNNPYSPPKSDVTPPPIPSDGMELLAEPRSLSAGAGISWLAESWPLVKSNLGVWVLITLALFAIQVILGLIPVAGDIASSLIGPILSGGILMGARAVYFGEPLRFDYLFEGFKQKLVPLLGLGGLTLGIMFLFGIIIGGAFVGMNMSSMETGVVSPEGMMSSLNIGLIAVGIILLLLVMMLFWFATQLVALNDVPVFQSLTLSFKACLRNPLPLLLYGLAVFVLMLLGALPLLLGLLVVVPWLFASMYVSYKQIFLQ